MPISDKQAVQLLKEELEFYNQTRKTEWPLEPVKIQKQSDHFWQLWSNYGSEDSIELLIDADRGRVLKNSHKVTYNKAGHPNDHFCEARIAHGPKQHLCPEPPQARKDP